jgi:hypothetical protein
MPFAGGLGKQFLAFYSLLGLLDVRRGNMRLETGFIAPFHVEEEQSRILGTL